MFYFHSTIYLKGCPILIYHYIFSTTQLLEDGKDLIFNVSFKDLLPKKMSTNFTIGGLNKGIKFEKNYFGIEFSISVF